MKAAVLPGFGQPLEVAEVPDPQIVTPTDVIVRIEGAGVCGSDVHLAEGALVKAIGTPPFPWIMGHENAGFIEAIGDAVVGLRPGDPVLAHPFVSCGHCNECRHARETYCENGWFPGVDGVNPGGFAEYLRTDQRAILKLPEGTDPVPLAGIGDAGLSAYHAIRLIADRLPPDGAAAVIGIGGLGYFALQLVRAFSPATVIAVDTQDRQLDLARELSADHCLSASASVGEEMIEMTAGRGVDVVVDCVGVEETVQSAIAALRRGGSYLALGAGGGNFCCDTLAMTGRELTAQGSLMGSMAELAELVGLALRDRIRLVEGRYPIARTEDAMAAMRDGSVTGRAVILPHS